MITSLRQKRVTRQIDFPNAFVQAPMERDVYIALPAMFADTSAVAQNQLCLKLNKSLYGLWKAPKLWADWLAKGLDKAGFVPSEDDPGIFYGRGMALAVYVDDVLFFGHVESGMKKVIT